MKTLENIELFVNVAETSTVKAAEKYYFSVSSVNRRITELENEVGFKLFEGPKNKRVLTADGMEYFHLCKEIMNTYNSFFSNKQNKQINVGVSLFFYLYKLINVIGDLETSAMCQCDLVYFDENEAIEKLRDYDVDMLFCYKKGILENEFLFIPIFKEQNFAKISEKNTLFERDTLKIDDLSSSVLITDPNVCYDLYHNLLEKNFSINQAAYQLWLKRISRNNAVILSPKSVAEFLTNNRSKDLKVESCYTEFGVLLLKKNYNKYLNEIKFFVEAIKNTIKKNKPDIIICDNI